jgi:hypothetical protein
MDIIFKKYALAALCLCIFIMASLASGSVHYGGGTEVGVAGANGAGEFDTQVNGMQVVASGITVGSPVTFDTTKSYTLPNGDRVSAELDIQQFIGTYNFNAQNKPQTLPLIGLQASVDVSGAIGDKIAATVSAENIYSGRKAQTDIEILGSPGSVGKITARAGHTTATAPYTSSIYVPVGTATGTDITINGLAQESASELSKVHLKLLNKNANLAYYDGTVASTVAGGDTAITLDANGKGRLRDQLDSQNAADVKTMAGNSLTNYVDANLNLDAWTASAHVTSDSTFNVYAAGNPAKTIQGAVDGAMSGDSVILRDLGTYSENVNVPAKSLTIAGQGIGSVVDGQAAGSVFIVQPGADVGFKDMTIRNGLSDFGGGIKNQGTAALTNVKMTDNRATNSGGAVANYGSLILRNSELSSNNAELKGGAIFNQGSADIKDSDIWGNTAGGIIQLLPMGAAVFSGYNDDHSSGSISFDFPFDLFGAAYSQFYISPNGYISLNGASYSWIGWIPNRDGIVRVAPFYTDLEDNGGDIHLATGTSSRGNQVIQVDWNNVEGFFASWRDDFTLYIENDPSGDIIVFDYGNMQGCHDYTAIGFDADPSHYLLLGTPHSAADLGPFTNTRYVFRIDSNGVPVYISSDGLPGEGGGIFNSGSLNLNGQLNQVHDNSPDQIAS